VGLVKRVFLPRAPVYLRVTPQWLIEARNRPVEELMQLKWFGLLGTRALGITKKELVQCLKDDECFRSLIWSICAAVKTGNVRTKREYLKRWLVFCIPYWQT